MTGVREIFANVLERRPYPIDEVDSLDLEAVEALASHALPIEVRRSLMIRWIHLYNVDQGLTTAQRVDAVDAILAFADKHRRKPPPIGPSDIVDMFTELEGQLQGSLPRTSDGSPRKVTSLASKVLWCCYPDEVPIYDRFARNALIVISRLCGMQGANAPSEYGQFLQLWIEVYVELRQDIASAYPDYTSHQVRLFDRLLWYLGGGGS